MSAAAGSSRAGALAVAAKLGGAGLGIFVNVILARLLGPEEFGKYALGIAIGTVAVVLASGGMPFGAIRFVPGYLASNDFAALRGFHRASMSVTVLGGVICTGALLLTAQRLDSGHLMADVLPWAALMILPAALAQSLASLLQGRGHVSGPEVIQSLVRQAATLGLVLLWIAAARAMDFSVALACGALAVAIAAVALWVWLERVTRPEPRPTKIAFEDFRLWIAAGAGMLSILVVAALNERVDLFVLGWLAAPDAVGVYSASVRVASVAILAMAGLGAAYTPRVSAAWARGNRIEVERLCREGALVGATVTLAMTLGVWLFGGAVLSMFGPAFPAGATALTILLGSQVVVGMTGIANGLAIISGNSHIAMTGVAAGLIVNALAGIALVPHLGISGAAIGVFVGFIVSQGVIGIWCSLRLGLRATLLPIGPRALNIGVRHA
jgi:O-antigen/teichoic acid export membrane protein